MIIVDKCCPTIMSLYLMGVMGEETVVLDTITWNYTIYYTVINPLNNAEYSYNSVISGAWTTPSQHERGNYLYGKELTLTNAYIQARTLTVLGSTETSGLVLQNSSGVDVVQFADSIVFDKALNEYQWAGSQLLDAAEPYRFLLNTPTFTTPPQGVRLDIQLTGQIA